MQIRIQSNNIVAMAATLQDLAKKASEERDDIPDGFREFFYREVSAWPITRSRISREKHDFTSCYQPRRISIP